MIAAHQRVADAKLLVMDADGGLVAAPRTALVDFLRSGDVVVANDAATLPASLHGVHRPSGAIVEVRLAGWRSRDLRDPRHWVAIVFGAGDFRTRTEDRPLPPALNRGDRLQLGPLDGIVADTLDHPRLIALTLEGSVAHVWAGIARHGHPIQYAHVPQPLALWDVWTPLAGPPVAFEPPSATFTVDWQMQDAMRSRGIGLATLTHAAGISSTGDVALDARLPLPEPYVIPAATARAVRLAKSRGGRIIAIGTTVVRALEHAGAAGRLRGGTGVADQRITAGTALHVVDMIVSGTHEPGTSHYDLLRAFAGDPAMRAMNETLDACGFRTHEFGDSVLIARRRAAFPLRNIRIIPPLTRERAAPTL
jgi:S-adenosylmethionine:tRNA ribosyltransferase-isomerase